MLGSRIGNTGEYGYGTYAIGDATVRVLGSRFDVGSYATIIAGPAAVVHYGDSTRDAVAALNEELELGLSSAELKCIPVTNTVVDSGHFGYMFFGTAALTLAADAAIRAPRGKSLTVTVDGTETTVTAGQTHTGAITLTVA